jgi:hypothetical protein
VVRGGIAVLTLVALAIGVGGYLFLTADNREYERFAKELGTKFILQSVAKGGLGRDSLHIDVGVSWAKFQGSARTEELRTLAEGAKGLGFNQIYIFSDSNQVAEIHDGKVCPDPTCFARGSPAMITSQPGAAPPPAGPAATPAAAPPPAGGPPPGGGPPRAAGPGPSGAPATSPGPAPAATAGKPPATPGPPPAGKPAAAQGSEAR